MNARQLPSPLERPEQPHKQGPARRVSDSRSATQLIQEVARPHNAPQGHAWGAFLGP